MQKASLLLLALLLGACHCEDDPAAKTGSGQFLFEVSYTNFAWGYSHRGMTIDSAGRIHTFEWSRTGAPWEPNENETYTAAELAAKYTPGARARGTVSGDSLRMMQNYFTPAQAGPMSDTVMRMADAGTTHYSLYRFDPATELYTRIALRQRGDWEFDNMAPAAGALADLLDAYWIKVAP